MFWCCEWLSCPYLCSKRTTHNQKGWYSMIIQELVNAKYEFLDICIGWPGSIHDARVFVYSNLCKKITHGHFVLNKSITISGVHVPLYMIGDSAYPMQS